MALNRRIEVSNDDRMAQGARFAQNYWFPESERCCWVARQRSGNSEKNKQRTSWTETLPVALMGMRSNTVNAHSKEKRWSICGFVRISPNHIGLRNVRLLRRALDVKPLDARSHRVRSAIELSDRSRPIGKGHCTCVSADAVRIASRRTRLTRSGGSTKSLCTHRLV